MIRYGTSISVVEPTDVAAARRTATQCAEALRLDENTVARVALVATELATNLVKHGGGGALVFGLDEESVPALHIIAADKGGGISNVATAMRDGFSTAGSPGTGLGAISRSAVGTEVYSVDGKGTVVSCRVEPPQRQVERRPAAAFEVAGICLPKSGENVPGDSWAATRREGSIIVLVADGLGHGELAATASAAATRVLKEDGDPPAVAEIIHSAHAALRGTRGAAVAVAKIDAAAQTVEFAGVGNIAGTIAGGGTARRTVSHNGIVGHEMRKVQTFTYPWTADSILVLHSDGISTSWILESYAGLETRSAAIIAGVIHRDHCRGNDDATIVVVKARG